MNARNYKVSGAKMTGKNGQSNRELRLEGKWFAERFGDFYQNESGTRRLKYATRRLAKKCKHKHMVDMGHGGPESGYIDLRCKDCGYTHYVRLY